MGHGLLASAPIVTEDVGDFHVTQQHENVAARFGHSQLRQAISTFLGAESLSEGVTSTTEMRTRFLGIDTT
jgi:hypothetical protein